MLEGGGKTKPKTKGPRGAPRAGVAVRPRAPAPSAHGDSRDRARGLKKARGPTEASRLHGGGGPTGRRSNQNDLPPAPDRAAGWSVATDSARSTATAIAVAALDKKAVGLEILDVAGKVDYADFLVIMTGRSDRHAVALAQGIEEALRKQGVRPVAVEGMPHGSWVLMDFGDVVVHVFQDDSRRIYDIEGLWLDARRLPVPADQPPDA